MINMQSDATDAIRATIDELERLTAELWARRVEKDGVLQSKNDLARLKQELADWLAWHERMGYDYTGPPRCVHYDGEKALSCRAGIADEDVEWPLMGYSDNLPCLDASLPCPKRRWAESEPETQPRNRKHLT